LILEPLWNSRDSSPHLGLMLAGVEELEPLEQRLRGWTVDDALLKLADEVRDTGEVRFHTFHASPEDSDTS
jgi:hypothetical protein